MSNLGLNPTFCWCCAILFLLLVSSVLFTTMRVQNTSADEPVGWGLGVGEEGRKEGGGELSS